MAQALPARPSPRFRPQERHQQRGGSGTGRERDKWEEKQCSHAMGLRTKRDHPRIGGQPKRTTVKDGAHTPEAAHANGTTPALVASLEYKNRGDNELCYRGTPRLFGRISYGRTAPPQCKRKSPLTCTAAMAPLLMALVLMHGAYVGAAVPLRGLWWWRDATVRAGKGVVRTRETHTCTEPC